MSLLWRIISGLLLGWALFLYLGDPVLTLEVDNGESRLAVECFSLADRAFGGDGYVDTSGIPHTYTVAQGEEPESDAQSGHGPFEITKQLNDYCDRTRTARAAGIGLLAAPIAIFGMLGFVLPQSPGAPAPGGTAAPLVRPPSFRRTEPHWSERRDPERSDAEAERSDVERPST